MWTLINNTSHKVFTFTSERKLRQYAKAQGWTIKRSYLDNHCFYTESLWSMQ